MPKVVVEKSNGIIRVKINRPDVLNACDGETYNALADARDELESDPGLRVGILSGAGDAFCVGTDVSWVTSPAAKGYEDRLYPKMLHGTKPVVAAVHGSCIGGGLELALACDIRLCTEDAKFGSGDIPLDWIPGGYGTQRLPRLIPLGNALELLYTGDVIDAHDAHRIGLVNHVLPDAVSLMEKAEQIAGRIVKRSPVAIEKLKTTIMDGLDMALPSAIRLGVEYYDFVMKTQTSRESAPPHAEKPEKE